MVCMHEIIENADWDNLDQKVGWLYAGAAVVINYRYSIQRAAPNQTRHDPGMILTAKTRDVYSDGNTELIFVCPN